MSKREANQDVERYEMIRVRCVGCGAALSVHRDDLEDDEEVFCTDCTVGAEADPEVEYWMIEFARADALDLSHLVAVARY